MEAGDLVWCRVVRENLARAIYWPWKGKMGTVGKGKGSPRPWAAPWGGGGDPAAAGGVARAGKL